jgi:ADP-ribosylglycohydrolase
MVQALWQRDWHHVQAQHFSGGDAISNAPFRFSRLQPGHAIQDAGLLSRAHGCLIGQVAGDALGSQVEFEDAATLRNRYPDGLRTMEDGGPFQLIAGQPTDDSELALLLARTLANERRYDREKIAQAYHFWFHRSRPFDLGNTIRQAMQEIPHDVVESNGVANAMASNASQESEANGSLMRISPLAIFGHDLRAEDLFELAEIESSLTHPHPVCRQCCGLYCIAVARALSGKFTIAELYDEMKRYAASFNVHPSVSQALLRAASERPLTYKGWVLSAFQNAFYQLLHSNRFEDGIVDTVMQGLDTDTNAAIAGALLGAFHGREAIPHQWRSMVLSCRSDVAHGSKQPRPWAFWPVDLTNLAETLLLK